MTSLYIEKKVMKSINFRLAFWVLCILLLSSCAKKYIQPASQDGMRCVSQSQQVRSECDYQAQDIKGRCMNRVQESANIQFNGAMQQYNLNFPVFQQCVSEFQYKQQAKKKILNNKFYRARERFNSCSRKENNWLQCTRIYQLNPKKLNIYKTIKTFGKTQKVLIYRSTIKQKCGSKPASCTYKQNKLQQITYALNNMPSHSCQAPIKPEFNQFLNNQSCLQEYNRSTRKCENNFDSQFRLCGGKIE